MDKQLRHQLIKQAILEQTINSQSDIVAYLAKKGYQITQATISRDISELHLIKVAQNGEFVYRLPQTRPDNQGTDAFHTLLNDANAQISRQDNLINVETLPGSGSVIANAIKQRRWPEIFAVIPTDDSALLIIKKDSAAVDAVWARLASVLG
ncbi:arginine repressor [Lapidilactobacillus mulanensis]|uniref:Arginine repressor n=1 Tax=Lapidilactobacillus mulanensis TaxID=2485999 RepID=A0ABW4DNZ0_9LACO|nr:hypothetical protein [Lapidilactobacillus mulanensis]